MKRILLGASLGVVGVVAVPGVQAQTAGAANASEPAQLEKVVVTAQKRSEAAQDVGTALTVLTGKEVSERGITTVNQLQSEVPSLEIEPAFGSGQPQYRIRGVGFQDYAANNSPTVGVYVDEVAYSLPIMTQGLLFDLSRVEVLRGPQGTLYGRNTTGGAVNFVTNRPTREFSTGATIDYGAYNALNAQGYVSGSLADNVRGRLSGALAQGGGWQHNRVTGESLGDKDQYALRGQLEWDVTDRFNLRFSAHTGQDKSENQGLYLFTPKTGPGTATARDTNRSSTGWGFSPAFTQATGFGTNAKPSRDNKSEGYSLVANLDLGGAQLTSISAYEKFRRRELNDWDGTAARDSDEFFGSNADVFSQEVRLASTGSGPWNWVTGVYYAKENLKENFLSDFSNSLGLPIVKTSYSQKAETIALFGQTDYKLTDRLKVVGGLRHESEDRQLRNYSTGTTTGISFIPTTSKSTSLSEVTGKLGLEYQLQPSTLLYTSVSRGVKSGGFTAYNTTNVLQLEPFKPEELWAYEGGFKSDLTRTLRLNGAAFYYDYRKQQVLSAVWDPTYGPIGRIVNAPKSEIWGGELELLWEPLSGLKVSQYLGYKEGKFKDFRGLDVAASTSAGAPVYVDYAGKDLNFPKLSYGGLLSYAWNAGTYKVRAETDYSFRDKYNSWLGKTYDIKSYWLVNARVVLSPNSKKENWSVALYGRNILNEKYDQTRNFFLPGNNVAQAGQPATYGVQLSFAY